MNYNDERDIRSLFGISALSVADQMRELERSWIDRLVDQHELSHLADIASSASGLSVLNEYDHWHRNQYERLAEACEPLRQLDRAVSALAVPSELLDSLTVAIEGAGRAGQLQLPDVLEPYRLPDVALAARLGAAHQLPWWTDDHLTALNTHATLSSYLDEVGKVDAATYSAVESVLLTRLDELQSIRQAQQFLGLAGLLHYPRTRTLHQVDHQRAFKRLVKTNAPSPHTRKAVSLSHSNERALRIVIAQAMEREYGLNWANERLPLCDCKTLLGRPIAEGESILDTADYTHYIKIMCDQEHFEAVFSHGFACPDKLRATIEALKKLRARSNHARIFTAEDLRELGALWRLVARGLTYLIGEDESWR